MHNARMFTTVRLDKKDHEALKAIAKQNGQMITFVLSLAVRQYIESHKEQKAQAA